MKFVRARFVLLGGAADGGTAAAMAGELAGEVDIRSSASSPSSAFRFRPDMLEGYEEEEPRSHHVSTASALRAQARPLPM